MGSLGAVLEITLVSYILAASVIGFYTTTFFKRLIPRIGDTPLTLVSVHNPHGIARISLFVCPKKSLAGKLGKLFS